MQKLLIFTDVHIVPEGETIIGIDPAERFAQGLAHAMTHHADAARVIITGDLTHHGTPGEYMRLRKCLTACPLPVHMTLGNHDRRAGFYAVFPNAVQTATGHAQEVIDQDDTRLILLDTLNEEAKDLHSGLLCQDRLDWMDQAISEAGGRRVILFLHHPPVLTGFAGMDSIELRNRGELGATAGASFQCGADHCRSHPPYDQHQSEHRQWSIDPDNDLKKHLSPDADGAWV